ncbi:MAG: OmpA family protein [Hyphomicrobium sp.]
MRCHPTRWLWGLIPIAMLSWLAVHLETDFIQRDLETRSAAALRGAGFDWASVAFSGRDGLLVGQAAAPAQLEEAAAVVRNVWGVRTVETRVAVAAEIDLPVATAADDIVPDGTIDDIAPHTLYGRPADEPLLALAPSEYAPPTTVQAHDYVEPAPPPTALPPVPTSKPLEAPQATLPTDTPAPAAETLPIADTAPVAAEQKPLPAAVVPETVTTAEAAVALPEQKAVPTIPGAPAPPAPPPEQQAAAVVPSLPEHKPATPTAVVAAADSTPAMPQHKPEPPRPDVAHAPVAAAPPMPEHAPRFETAALPPGNISSDGDCLSGVRGAAQQVEVHFGHGRAMLDTAGKALIDRLIGALNICPEAKISVSGHADASGLSRRNLALSKHRARAVANYMTQKGIDAGRLNAIGYGDKRPVVPNDTQANMAKNRRIELAITARPAPLPPMPVRKQGMLDGLSRR